MKWLKRIGIVLGVIILILAVVPFFISLNDYIPQIEKEASTRLKEPVTIKSLRTVALPLPHLTVNGITVGTVTVTPICSARCLWNARLAALVSNRRGAC